MNKKKYLVNGFAYLITKNLAPYLKDYTFSEDFPKPTRYALITNFCQFLWHKIRGTHKLFNVIHLNTWETMILSKKYSGKVLIGESHGFHFGLNFQDTLKHFQGGKKWLASRIENIVRPLLWKKIQKLDLYYVSTPNMMEHALKIRKDAMWLPNAINTDIFCPEGERADMPGDPVIFCPTRLHSFKNPDFGINLFQKIKEKYPNATLHLIRYPHGGDPLAEKYERELQDPATYFWHGFQDKPGLAEMYRSSDIVLGHFHPSLGMMSLVELEATNCGAAVISYDKYEIHTPLEDLENIAFEILGDRQKYDDFVSKNRAIVLEKHDPKNIAKRLINDIARVDAEIFPELLNPEIIEKYNDDFTEIENRVFQDVEMWGKKEFLYPNKNKFDVSFALRAKNKIIGFVIGYTDNQYAYINRIAVHPDYSGKGYGKLLLEIFENNARSLEKAKVLELVTHDTLSVDTFYKKNGFQIVESESEILEFLERKAKMDQKDFYIGDKKYMILYSKIL